MEVVTVDKDILDFLKAIYFGSYSNPYTAASNRAYLDMNRTIRFQGVSSVNAVRELYIVRIELDTGDDAQQIFESINSTGEKLTAADLIRNYIMMRHTNDEQETIYEKYWLKLEKIFPESKKMAEYFRFYLAAKTYTLTSEKELYSEFKIYWKEHNGASEYLSILEDLLHFAQHFKRLYLSTENDSLGIALQDYRKLQSYMPAPFAMSVLEHLRIQELSDVQVQDVFKVLNTYLVRRYINGQDTSAISRFFPGYLKNVEKQIEAEGNYSKYVDIVIYYLVNENKGKAAFMPDDNQIYTYLQTANAYSLSNIRWVLDKIESYKNPVPVDLSALNIEHVMPQTSNEYWLSVPGVEADDYIDVVNRIGNLTLAAVTDNSKMGNKDFACKKKVLETTKHLKLNENILTKDKWTVADIDSRTKLLSDKIIEIFPYVKTNYVVTGKDEKRYISLNAKGITAMGYLNEDNTLTVFADSQIKYDVLPSADSLKDMREDFLEQEIVILKDGMYVFAQNYTFGAPSAAADFIIGGSNNGWQYWKDSDNNVIGDSLRD